MKAYKAILINPTDRSIGWVEMDGSLTDIYQKVDCQTIDSIQLTHNECVYVDDEALLLDEQKPFFGFLGSNLKLSGNGLVVGTTEDGDTTTPSRLSPEIIKNLIVWYGDLHIEPHIEFVGFE